MTIFSKMIKLTKYYTCYTLYQIGGKELLVGLRTPHWREQIEREMSLVRSNTGTLFNTFTNSLLGEDFSIPTMSFDGKVLVKLYFFFILQS